METATEIKVLLIEDDPGDARLVAQVLKQAANDHFALVTVDTLAAGLKLLSEHSFHVVLLDLSLPDNFGVSTLDDLLRQIPDQPIIVLAGARDEQLALEAGQRGALDYLVKSEIPGGVLPRSIVYAIERKQAELKLSRTVEALKAANQAILKHQTSVIEEERLKVLLQMAGATSHELNQPLMNLLSCIETMRLDEKVPERFSRHIEMIDEFGRRIAEIVKKMSAIRLVESKPDPGIEVSIDVDQQTHILYLEDSDEDFEILQAHLDDQTNIELTRADSMAEAVSLLAKKKFDLIFVDYLLPGATGLDFLQWMGKASLDTPAIAMTGHGDEEIATNMIKSGAYDYLPKASIDQNVLLNCILLALEKFKLKKEVEQANERMVRMATRDPLTGLYNRFNMNDLLTQEFNRAKRYGSDLACLLMDLDYFKEVNDTLGHAFGDSVLEQFAARLTENLRESDACFRYGGEEFMVLLPQIDIQGAKKAAENIRRLCGGEPYSNGDHESIVTVSIGISSFKHEAPTRPEDLLAHADKALYHAKADGRNRVKVYLEDFSAGPGPKDGHAVDLKQLKDRLAAILDKTKKASVDALELMVRNAGGARFKDHNQRVVQYLGLVGAKLGLSPAIIQTLQRASAFHDCTKVLLSETLLEKKVQLDEDELAQIKDHPFILSELIEPFDMFANERAALLYHHENYDGSGYPNGLAGDQIPLGARIFSIADALVAMMSERPHRPKLSAEQVVRELVDHAGAQFDPMLAELFLDVITEDKLLDVPAEIIAEAKQKMAGLKVAQT